VVSFYNINLEEETLVILVRQATAKDVDVIYDLIFAMAGHQNQERFITTDKRKLLEAGFSESPDFGVLLAEFNGQVIGYLSYTWNYSIWLGSHYMNIDDVFVLEEFRSQKAGEALMLKAREVCQSKGLSRIRWEVQKDNHRAIKFYENLGAELNMKGVFRWSV
jgi:ribosomal protein S18 acetylase RimI-like enzyme